MTTKSPAFQFYAHDFLAGRVATYSLEEVGAYTTLLAFDWTLNGLPTRREDLARLLRVSTRKFDALWARLSDQFEERDGRMFNRRLDLERVKQAEYSAKMSANGKLGGKPKLSRGLAEAKPIESSPSPSPTPVPKKLSRPAADASDSNLAKLPKATVDAGHERWTKRFGAMAYPRFRKALLPLFIASPLVYDGPQLAAAVDAFSDGADAVEPKWRGQWNPEKFAGELHTWVRLGAMELVDEWGLPTERGRATGIFAA